MIDLCSADSDATARKRDRNAITRLIFNSTALGFHLPFGFSLFDLPLFFPFSPFLPFPLPFFSRLSALPHFLQASYYLFFILCSSALILTNFKVVAPGQDGGRLLRKSLRPRPPTKNRKPRRDTPPSFSLVVSLRWA